MTLTDNIKARSIAARAKAMILSPRSEWDGINIEPVTVRSLFTGYVIYLAAIPAICTFIGQLVFTGALWHPSRMSPLGLVVSAILDYAFTLASVYALGVIIEQLAPFFGGTKDRIQAMKISAFFPTAWWLAGVFAIVPQLALLRLLGLFSLFVLWLGLPKLMRAPPEKALLYTLCVIVSAIVLGMIVSIIAGMAMVSTLA